MENGSLIYLQEQVDAVVRLTDAEHAELASRLTAVTLAKGDYLLHEGEVCRFVGLICQGAMIYCRSMENGAEATTDFAFEGSWVSVNQSRISGLPSPISIKAVEPTVVLTVSHTDLNNLYSTIPKLERLGRLLMEKAFLGLVEQSVQLQVLPAKERYISLLKRYPQVFNRIQLYHIASYLGIAPKSLSRIRRQVVK